MKKTCINILNYIEKNYNNLKTYTDFLKQNYKPQNTKEPT